MNTYNAVSADVEASEYIVQNKTLTRCVAPCRQALYQGEVVVDAAFNVNPCTLRVTG